MPRRTWDELPPTVHAAIERQVGPVTRVVLPSAGRNSDISATLHTADGPVFCKGIADAEGNRGRMHRHEADINEWLPSAVAPQLRWRTEAGDWLLLGFDHVPGRHVDLAPDSPDLPAVTEAVNHLSAALAHCPAHAPQLTQHWARLAAWRRMAHNTPDGLDEPTRERLAELVNWELHGIAAAAGDNLIHTDLHALNMLADDGRVRVVDWAWSRKGSPAVDAAFLVARMAAAGHTPAAAEQWADTLTAWRDTTSADRTALAVTIWGIWQYLEIHEPLPHRKELTDAARSWALYRLDVTTSSPRPPADLLPTR